MLFNYSEGFGKDYMSLLTFLLCILNFALIGCGIWLLERNNLKAKDLSQTSDTDMINELMKRGILSASPDGNGLSISSEVLREVHFNHMHEQQMTNVKNAIDTAALTAAMSAGALHGSDHDTHTHL